MKHMSSTVHHRKLAEGCDFHTITPNEILRDRLVFGISDSKVRERLLRESDLTLERTDEICRAAESMIVQMKIVDGNTGDMVSAIKSKPSVEQNTTLPHDRPGVIEC